MSFLNKYKVPVDMVYRGHVIVNALNKKMAKEMVVNGFGFHISGGILDSSFTQKEMPDWEFEAEPEKHIGKIKKL